MQVINFNRTLRHTVHLQAVLDYLQILYMIGFNIIDPALEFQHITVKTLICPFYKAVKFHLLSLCKLIAGLGKNKQQQKKLTPSVVILIFD